MTNYKIVPVEPTREMLVAINWPNDPAGYRAMLAAATSPWVSVEERLPEPENGSGESDFVLTYSPYGIIVGFYRHEEAHWYYRDGEEFELYVSEITHWMPIPEAPEVAS